ncbi:MAG: hypothetical protein ABSG73_10890 [Candidatus Aminicenantales bacterium]
MERWKDLLDEAYGGHPRFKARTGQTCTAGEVPASLIMETNRTGRKFQDHCPGWIFALKKI